MKQTSGFPPSLATREAAPIRASSRGRDEPSNLIPPKRVASELLLTPKKESVEAGADDGSHAPKPETLASLSPSTKIASVAVAPEAALRRITPVSLLIVSISLLVVAVPKFNCIPTSKLVMSSIVARVTVSLEAVVVASEPTTPI